MVSRIQLSECLDSHPHLPDTRSKTATNKASLRDDNPAGSLRYDYCGIGIRSVSTSPKALGKVAARELLESERTQQFLLFSLRIYNFHRRGASSCTYRRILGPTDETIHEDGLEYTHGNDHAVSCSHDN
jgi:hypothetical protein